ncbi:MAG: hypothetical protein WCV80_03450 [Candidatus Paceibacterota bacterium]|jgi:hypothetical protein
MQIKNFSENLEKDLGRLNAEINAQRKLPEVVEMPEREIVKRSVEAYAEKAIPTTPIPITSVTSSQSQNVLPTYLQDGDVSEEIKREVTRLVEVVFVNGIHAAVKEAQNHSPFVQDAFHDALVDKLMPELQKRGIVK